MEVLEGKVLEIFMEDFHRPNLVYYGKGSRQILCIGDSLTYGHGVVATRAIQSYPAVLSRLLGEGYQVINAGACGRGVLESGGYSYMKEGMFKELLALQPQDILVMLGTNDAKPSVWNANEFESSYRHLICTLQQTFTQAKFHLIIPPKIFRPEQGKIMEHYILPILHKIAMENHFNIIDLLRVTQHHSEWVWDGVHYDARGYEEMATTIHRMLHLP